MNENRRHRGQSETETQLTLAVTKVAELSRANAELRARLDERAREESGFDALVQSGVMGVIVVSRGGTVVEANDAFLRIVGYAREEIVGKSGGIARITAPEWRETTAGAMEELHARGEKQMWEKEYVRKDGTRARVLVANIAINDRTTLAFVVNLSEKKRAEDALRSTEEQLRQAQKMEAVGRLAGGVAHDFNNMLSVILSYGTLLSEGLEEGSQLGADLGEIRAAATRAAALTRQLLLFSRQQVIEPLPVDLNEVVDGVQKMLGRTLGEDVELVVERGENLGRVMADPNQIEQVLMNLVVNARDAMPTGGTLTIETRFVQRAEGPAVVLSVRDTGTGMDQQTKVHMFEPFYTTKERGKGTGLGLSTVFGIVKQTGGDIFVESRLGAGTSFQIFFPRVDVAAVAARLPTQPTTLRGTETILLVEDEDQVRAVAGSILRRQGYQVIEAKEPLEALRLYEERPGDIDLLLTDVVMPKMSGVELARRVGLANCGTRVLCMSGYTDDVILQHGVAESGVAFLQKPLTPGSLSRKVREVLEECRSP